MFNVGGRVLNLGLSEILIVLVVALVIVGPDRLPTVVKWLGRQYGKLMRASDELRRAFTLEADKVEAEARAKILRQRREEARARIAAARALTDGPIPRPLAHSPVPEDATELGDDLLATKDTS
jgi:Tat protein translocase TatB subunit